MQPPIFALAFLAVSAPLCLAEKNVDLKPLLVVPGRQTANETFPGSDLPKTWTIAKGEWWVRDGTLIGKEKKEDHHPSVCKLIVPNHDSILRFSFRLEGAQFLSLNYNIEKDHLFRVVISPTDVKLRVDKDGKDPQSKVVVLGTAKVQFERGKWYTAQIEVKGPEIVVQGDNGWTIKGSNPRVDVDKLDYRFAGWGEYVVVADVKAWEAVP